MKRDPYLVVEWSDRESEAVGWFAIYNFADEQAAGGLRMTDNVTRDEVERLAQVMSYKYVAAENMCGGAKAGIKYDYHKPDALDVIKRFLMAVKPYLTVQHRKPTTSGRNKPLPTMQLLPSNVRSRTIWTNRQGLKSETNI